MRALKLYIIKFIVLFLPLCIFSPVVLADFYNYARYLNLQLEPEIQLIRDAYRHVKKPTQTNIRTLNRLLAINRKSRSRSLNHVRVHAQASLFLASLLFRQGDYAMAEDILNHAKKSIRDSDDMKLQLYLSYQFGILAFFSRRYEASTAYYTSARDMSIQLSNKTMMALTELALGEVQLLTGNTSSALHNFKTAYSGLRKLDKVILAADAGILFFALTSKRRNTSFSDINIPELIDLIRLTPDETKRMQQMSEILETYHSIADGILPQSTINKFRQLENESFSLPSKSKNEQGQRVVSSNVVQTFENEENYSIALELIQDTLTKNQDRLSNKELIPLYLKQARLLKMSGQNEDSILVYQAALLLLKSSILDRERANTTKTVQRLVRVYDELISLFFNKQEPLPADVRMPKTLVELRSYIEERNYFYFNALRSRNYADFLVSKKSVPILSKEAAVLYPVLFDDRLEVLISFPNALSRYTCKISKKRLLQASSMLRKSIAQPELKLEYKKNAMLLYNCLIRPAKQQLLQRNINTLVFVLDKGLSGLPTSVLFDKKGRRYLIEQYAIAVSPGLMLTDVSIRHRARGGVLILGVESETTNADAPRLLDLEIKSISATTRVSTLRNNAIIESDILNVISTDDLNKIHISAPLFMQPQLKNSYMLSNNRKLQLLPMLGTLKQKRKLELVVLSGDVIQSVGVRSGGGILALADTFGSRSAVATLWPRVSEATPLFMAEFYTFLSASSISVATAVRRAKIRLIASKDYQHPAYWARFELFGNWL